MTRQRLYLMVAGIAVALVLAWYFLLWLPQSNSLAKARTRRQAALQQTQQLETQLQRLKAAQQNEAAKLAQLEKLQLAIPDQPNLGQFILDTNQAASDAGVAFLSIAPTVPAAAAGTAAGASAPAAGSASSGGAAAPARAAEIKMSISVTGGYFQLLDFMNRLNKLSRLIVIDAITVSPQASPSGIQLTVSLTGRMFVNPAAVSASTPGATAPAAGPTTTTTAPGATTTTTPGTTATTGSAGATTTTAGSR